MSAAHNMSAVPAGGSVDPLPPANELVIGLVGAVGIDLDSVFRFISVVLNDFAYHVHLIHLSEQMQTLTWDEALPAKPFDEHVWAYMSAGDKLRSPDCWDRNDAFALLGIHRVAVTRGETSSNIDVPADRQAYVLRSLKRPEEVALLRQVYGSRFVLIACYSPTSKRQAFLAQQIRESRVKPYDATPAHDASSLMDRDEREALGYGQNVLGTFHLADFFVDASDFDITKADEEGTARPRFELEIRRIMDILFGCPRRTPSRDEFGMTQAAAAMRRSAELGRQVGAAICTVDGDVVAVGVNDVPKAGGGLYWEGDPGDRREFRLGRDTSDEHKLGIAREIVERLAKAELLIEGVNEAAILEEISKTNLDNLIEFVRAVHAEMAALTDAARRGIPVEGCTMFVTTFPCHHCARHIVSAGITRVVYVAPYAKSMAEELHSDSIVVTSNVMLEAERSGDEDGRVRFEPFVGVGPERYLEMFFAPPRKYETGELIEWSPSSAEPRLSDLEPVELRGERLPYLLRERHAQDLLADVIELRQPKLSLDPPPRKRTRAGRGKAKS